MPHLAESTVCLQQLLVVRHVFWFEVWMSGDSASLSLLASLAPFRLYQFVARVVSAALQLYLQALVANIRRIVCFACHPQRESQPSILAVEMHVGREHAAQ